jgi:hypothetical protein
VEAKTYDLKFDEETKGYKPVDITAVLKQLQQGQYVEVDFTEIEFKPEVDQLLTFEVRKEDKYNIAKVDLAKEALNRADFDQVIQDPVKVHVTAKPPVEAGKAAPPDVKAECLVRVAPMPAIVKVLRPTPEEFPWPAKPEPKMPVELQIFRGSESKPLANTVVNLERKTPNDPPCGDWDAESRPPKTTDEQGRVSFTFVPNELYYKPHGKYFEEYRVFTGEGDKRREIGSFKLALAPKLRFRLEVEKKASFGDEAQKKEFAVDFGEKPAPIELELGPQLKIDALEILAELPDDGQSSTTRLPVAYAKLKMTFLDKEDKEPPAAGDPPLTETNGQYTWKFPELTAAFKEPATYKLKEHDQNPVGKLNAGSEGCIKSYRERVEKFTPQELLEATLYQELVEYRKIFCGQMAGQKTEKYETVESAAELLCAAATHTRLFNSMYNDQWGRLGEVIGNIFSDVLSLVINLKGVGDKCVKDLAPNAPTYFRALIDKVASWSWVQKLIQKVTPRLARIRGVLEEVIAFLREHVGGTLRSLMNNISSLFESLKQDLDELVQTTASPNAGWNEVKEKIVEWATNFFKLVFRVVGKVLLLIADIIVGMVSVLTKFIAGLCSGAFDALPPGIQQWIAETLPLGGERIIQALKRTFTCEDHGYGALSLAKLIEVLIGCVNEKLELTSGAGELSGKAIVKSLGLMDWMADPVLQYSKGNAEGLKVASAHEPVMKDFRKFLSDLSEFKREDEVSYAEIDKYAAYFDNAVLCIELIIMLVVTIFSLGGAAAIGEIFTQVEIAIGAVKLAIVRFPQAIWVMVLAFFILIMYVAGTMKVTYQGTAAATP